MYSRGTGYDNSIDDNNNKNKNNSNNNNNNDNNNLAKVIPREGYSCVQVRLEVRLFIFADGGKPEDLEKNPQSKDGNQKQTQLTCDARSGNWNPGHSSVM